MSYLDRTWCPKCNHSCNSPYCGTCGSHTVKFNYNCPHCNEAVTPLDKFCPQCGKPIQEEVRRCISEEALMYVGE